MRDEVLRLQRLNVAKFGILSDANVFYVDSFVRKFDGKYVAAAHEAGATLMAAPALKRQAAAPGRREVEPGEDAAAAVVSAMRPRSRS
jgi:hypothetical protein